MNPEILDLTRPRVMAIVNVTPDSFYAGSRTFTAAEIERRAMTAADEGAYMLDIGATPRDPEPMTSPRRRSSPAWRGRWR